MLSKSVTIRLKSGKVDDFIEVGKILCNDKSINFEVRIPCGNNKGIIYHQKEDINSFKVTSE